MQQTLATKLRLWRGKRYQKEAADIIGVPLWTYRNWEMGRKTPTKFTERFLLQVIDRK
jgi:DNA-binding transcriptional regulator YiaG